VAVKQYRGAHDKPSYNKWQQKAGFTELNRRCPDLKLTEKKIHFERRGFGDGQVNRGGHKKTQKGFIGLGAKTTRGWFKESVLFFEDQRWEVGNRWSFTKNSAISYLRSLRNCRGGINVNSRVRVLRLSSWLLKRLGEVACSHGPQKLLKFKLNLLILESARLLSAGFGIKGFKNYSYRAFNIHYTAHENAENRSGALLIRIGLLLMRAYRLVLSIGRRDLIGVGGGAATLLKFSKYFYHKLVGWWKVVLDIGILEGLVSVDERRGWLRYYWTLTDTKERLSKLPLWVRSYGTTNCSWQYLKRRPYPVSSLADFNDFFFWRNRFRCRSELGFDWLSRLKNIVKRLSIVEPRVSHSYSPYFVLNCPYSAYTSNSLGSVSWVLLGSILRAEIFSWLTGLFTYSSSARVSLFSYSKLSSLLYLILYKQLYIGLRVSLFSVAGSRTNCLVFNCD